MQLAVAPELEGWQLREEARSRGEPCAKVELPKLSGLRKEMLREVGRDEGREGEGAGSKRKWRERRGYRQKQKATPSMCCDGLDRGLSVTDKSLPLSPI